MLTSREPLSFRKQFLLLTDFDMWNHSFDIIAEFGWISLQDIQKPSNFVISWTNLLCHVINKWVVSACGIYCPVIELGEVNLKKASGCFRLL